MLGVGLYKGDVTGDARIDQAVTAAREHRGIDIAQHNQAARTDLSCQARSEIAAAPRDIECPLPGAQIRQCERKALP